MDSINHSTALRIAQARIHELGASSGDELEILSMETQEIKLGWVFFYNSAEYIRTGNPSSALAGNGPILVLRNGEIVELPTAVSWQEAVRKMSQPATERLSSLM